jgi:multicomponent Na+:H+ antiporter subunit E
MGAQQGRTRVFARTAADMKGRRRVLRAASSVVVLFAFWVLLSGYFTPFLLLAGFACSVATVVFAWRMEVVDREGFPIDLGLRSFTYMPWLVKEILKSGWSVTRIILDPRLPISPTLVRFRPSQKSSVGLVTHANSITLTPGTISVEVGRDSFTVHALTRSGAEGVVDSEMDRRVSRFEGQR